MNDRKRLKKKKRRKDYEKKRNIIKGEMNSVLSGRQKGFSVEFPKKKKWEKFVK